MKMIPYIRVWGYIRYPEVCKMHRGDAIHVLLYSLSSIDSYRVGLFILYVSVPLAKCEFLGPKFSLRRTNRIKVELSPT